MIRDAQAVLARMAQQVASLFRVPRARRIRGGEFDREQRDALASYVAPPPRPRQPPYASLRQ